MFWGQPIYIMLEILWKKIRYARFSFQLLHFTNVFFVLFHYVHINKQMTIMIKFK